MSDRAVIIEVPAGTFLMLAPEAVDAFEAAIREQRRVDRTKRDLAAEIETFLAPNGPATAPEIARAVRARDGIVREVLGTDSRFIRASGHADRSARARLWSLVSRASGLGPDNGTSARNEGQ